MDLAQLQENAIKSIQLEDEDAYAQGYNRALLDIRAALCFAGGEYAALDVVLTLLDQQNMERLHKIKETKAEEAKTGKGKKKG